MNLFAEHPEKDIVAVFEDNGRVAYAYLRKTGRIVGDVWLYNSRSTPIEPEWSNPANMPFLNPAKFVKQGVCLTAPAGAEDVAFRWIDQEEGTLVVVLLRGQEIGVIGEGTQPGWAYLASKDGPCAKAMDGLPAAFFHFDSDRVTDTPAQCLS